MDRQDFEPSLTELPLAALWALAARIQLRLATVHRPEAAAAHERAAREAARYALNPRAQLAGLGGCIAATLATLIRSGMSLGSVGSSLVDAARADTCALLAFARRDQWDPFEPVDPAWLGPLWPAGVAPEPVVEGPNGPATVRRIPRPLAPREAAAPRPLRRSG